MHQARVGPDYQERLRLAATVGAICTQGPSEARLVTDVLSRVERYLNELSSAGDEASLLADLTSDDLYG